MLKVEVDCAHNSPHVTMRQGENEPLTTVFALNFVCFPYTQSFSKNSRQNGTDIIRADMETINSAASLCAASSESCKNET